jgi:peptidoglycan/xylan/chitin deacetylase (PgdA/CDA1 family)
MNLVAFSIKTKGLHNFMRRLWTVFARFGFSERRISQALFLLIATLSAYGSYPTFFIPAVVLRRHPRLMQRVAQSGAEVGIHGYVHNDYRTLSREEQERQTRLAMALFKTEQLPFEGFRNPYLGWTEEALSIFAELGFAYESNEAVLHEVIALESLPPLLRSGYEKSLSLFQAVAPSRYALRPHFEGSLLRLPTSIPDDEMLLDRLRIGDPRRIGEIWCQAFSRVYDWGGVYILNLHPERGQLCKEALKILLDYAAHLAEPVWIARLRDIAAWWRERRHFRFAIEPLGASHWRVQITCSARASVLTRQLTIKEQKPLAEPGGASEHGQLMQEWVVEAPRCPCIALSPATPLAVMSFLEEQGYAVTRADPSEAARYGYYLDRPQGLGNTRAARREACTALLEELETREMPLLSFACWPDHCRAALSISSDIDSITIQDFFLRIVEVMRPGVGRSIAPAEGVPGPQEQPA